MSRTGARAAIRWLLRGLVLLAVSVLRADIGAAQGREATALRPPPEVLSYPDIIYINGKIITMDDPSQQPTVGRIVQAMAVREDKILAVGTNEDVLRLKGPNTRVVDLNGRTVMPGIVEPHVHPSARAVYQPGLHLGVKIGRTPEETLQNIARMLKEANPAPGEWVFVQLYPAPELGIRSVQEQISLWLPTMKFGAKQLSAVAPNNPLAVMRTDVTRNAGEIFRVHDPLSKPVLVKKVAADAFLPTSAQLADAVAGRPNSPERAHLRRLPFLLSGSHHTVNFLNEMAMQETLKKIPWFKQAISEAYGEYGSELYWFSAGENRYWNGWMFFVGKVPVDKAAEQLRDHMMQWARAGITTFQSRAGSPGGLVDHALEYMARNNLLPIRLAFLLEVHRGASLDIGKAIYSHVGPLWRGPDEKGPGAKFWVAGIASEVWDIPGAQTCLGPDLDAPPAVKAAELCPEPGTLVYELFKDALAKGWRLAAIHTVGSHAARLFAKMVEEAVEEGALTIEQARAMRLFGAHSLAFGKVPDVVELWKKYNIIVPVNIQRALGIDGAGWILANYGPPEKAEEFIAPVKSLLDAGLKVTGELEIASPVPTSYFGAMGLYTTRYSRLLRRVVAPHEAVPPEIALKMMTIWAAEAVLAEHLVGSLEPGKFADFLILNKDILNTPPAEWNTILPLATFVGGEPVWLDPELKGELKL